MRKHCNIMLFEQVKQLLNSLFLIVVFIVCNYYLILTVHLFNHFIWFIAYFFIFLHLNKNIFNSIQPHFVSLIVVGKSIE